MTIELLKIPGQSFQMPKKFLKKFMPANDSFMKSRSMQFISSRILDASVWHLNRRSASRATLIGLFFAFVPLPMQMLFAAIFCIYARANLPLAIAFVWLTNPLTSIPVFYFTYQVGAFILGMPPQSVEWGEIWHQTDQWGLIWKPMLLGSLIFGVASAAIGYTTVDLLWRWKTVKRWHRRQAKRNGHS